MRRRFVWAGAAVVATLLASRVSAQTASGAIAGSVNDANHRPLAGAIVQVIESRLGAYAGDDGTYRIEHVPAGPVHVVARIPGYISDTVAVTVAANQTVTQPFTLRPTSVTLQTVTVTSPRLNETKAAALEEQKTADNIVSVLSGDEIRSLPNANAAEAAARIPGVTSERDEGEGKFVEIRGTPPWFQNVEIDGVHIPGTLNGDRSVKLDDVPSDLLGAIEVSKTLSADQDADAIGGTVNLVSKIPEGAPRGYVAGQYSYQSLENNSQGQGSFTYGGRVGNDNKIGFLLGGSYDRTNRVIEDVEPSYSADYVNASNGSITPIPNGSAYNHVYPSSWSEREYNYYRTRYGVDGDFDYRFSPTSTVWVKGLYSAFFDEANRWETNLGAGSDAFVGGVPTATGASVSNTVSNRGPVEHTWGGQAGGKNIVGLFHLDYSANYSGSSATTNDHLDDDYAGMGQSVGGSPILSNFNYGYNQSHLVPRYFVNGATQAALTTPSSWQLTDINTDNEATDGQDFGGQANALIPFSIGNLPASFKFGGKYTNEHKGYANFTVQYNFTGQGAPPTIANFPGTYNVSDFYGHICGGCYTLAPFGSMPLAQQYFHSAQGRGVNLTADPMAVYNDLLGTYAGTEQVAAAYAMQTLDVSQLHINVGLRMEQTTVGYAAWTAPDTGDHAASQLAVEHRSHSYTDWFPSVELRYAVDENTNVRAAFTRGIARPNYSDLAPSFNAVDASPGLRGNGLSLGNPALTPERAWNYDLLAEHYFPSVGVLSGGVFYKQISDFIFDRTFFYQGLNSFYNPTGPCTDALHNNCYYASQPQNGPSAHLWGVEADYTQHMTFLPGALKGIGFDVNWTHVESRAAVPLDTSVTYTDQNGKTVQAYTSAYRHSMIPRQFPNLFNASLLYDYSAVSARLSGQYTAASIYQYGADGTSNPASGDVWNYPHWQIDGSLVVTVYRATALQFQVLNLNNETFGFFTGLPGNGHSFNNQREYYGTTWYIGVRQGF